MFHQIVFLLLIVSSLSCNFNRFVVCFRSFMNIACRSIQNAANIKRFLRLHIFIKLGHRVKRDYNFVARITRGPQADCDFALVINFSFYRFGIRSCLATSHKQILKTPFSLTSSCILGFQATWQPTWAHFIHLLFTVRRRIAWRIVKYFWANNRGLQTQQYSIRQVARNPCRGRFNTEKTATWTSPRATKKKMSTFIEQPL